MPIKVVSIAPAQRSIRKFFTKPVATAFAVFFGFVFALGFKHVFVSASTSPWTQTDWSGGSSSGTVNSTVTTYSELSSTDATTSAGNLTLATNTGWYNSGWKYRRKLTLDNTTSNLGVTSEALTDFTILVVLTSSNIDYANTQDSGQDLRFTDSDGTTLLSYEIEKWDEAGTSYVWVKVPQIDIDSNTDYIYMYYGNSGASDAQNADNTWDNNYVSVWHFDETSGTDISDSAGSNPGTKVNSSDPQPTTGQIDGAQDFSADYVSIADSASLDLTGNMTISGWVTADSLTTWGSLLMKSSTGNWDNGYGIYYNNNLCAFVTNYNTYKACSSFNTTVSPRYVVATYDGSSLKLYLDAGSPTSASVAVAVSTNNSSLQIGRGAGGSYDWDGKIDEVRISSIARSAAHIAASYHSETNDFVTFDSQVGTYAASGTLTSNIFDTEQLSAWGTLTYTSSGSTVAVKVRSSNSSTMSGADEWNTCSAVSSGTDLSLTDCVTDGERYVQYQVALSTADQTTTPTFQDISIGFSSFDQTAPPTNASSITMATASSGGRSISAGDWNNASEPYFSWTAGSDNDGGSGLKGYCLYLGTDSNGNPATSKGILGTSPVSTTGSTCQFIVSSTNLNLTTSGYLGSSLADDSTYYLNVKAIDNGNNIFAGSSAQFNFQHDVTAPTNVAYISMPSGSFSNVTDMSFSWPTSGGNAASDVTSGVLGYQYQINSTVGTWLGTSTSSECGADYIPVATGSYTLTEDQDGDSIEVGNNVVYFRAIDEACSTSSVATYRTGNLSYGGAAPTFATSCDSITGVTVTPTSNTSNSFALSWSAATPSGSNEVEKYYYMVNTTPPSSLSTITSNTSTYIDNDLTTSVSAGTLTGSVKGSNTVYVVAVDDADNYSASNCIKGTYTLNSSLPDPPQSVSVSDASIKESELWRASLAWSAPSYKGTGSITYKIQRSTDDSTWTTVSTTTGTAYVDTVDESQEYFWRIGAYDTSAESIAAPTWATSVSLTPKGTFSEAPSLSSGPSVTNITTKQATVSWSTSRDADSKIQYGKKKGDYFDEEPSKSDQVTDHEIILTNLSPGTTYFYKAKWTDEDGNTGISSEKSFKTDPPPTVSEPKAAKIGIDSATISFTVSDAQKVVIYYGKNTSFGNSEEISVSSSESVQNVLLGGLDDDTKYYFKVNAFDSEDEEYAGNVLSFQTLPSPRITNIRVQQARNTAQPTAVITWNSNTAITSIVSFAPQGNPSASRDEVDLALKTGEHRAIIRSLLPETRYDLRVSGRDIAGNEAQGELQTFTTATDTRAPLISDLKVEGTSKTGSNVTSQLVVTWNTDEAATSQIEFAEGTGSTYSQKTQEDSNLTFNHLVVIPNLTPSKVYHLRAVSKDKAGNITNSIDVVTITPKATENALDLVVTNLREVFGFIGN